MSGFAVGDKLRHRASIDPETGLQRAGAIVYTVALPADKVGNLVVSNGDVWFLTPERHYVPSEKS